MRSLPNFLLLGSILMTVPLTASATVVVFDEAHSQLNSMMSDPDFSLAISSLIAAGHSLHTISVPITMGALDGYDMYVSGTLQQPYSAGEIAALQAYVAGGGTVLVSHDGGWSADGSVASVNAFLAPYGMVMASESTYPTGVVVNGFNTHCITEGIATLSFDFLRELTTISPPAVDLTVGGPDVLAVWEDTGAVFVLGDDNCWKDPATGGDYDINDHDNMVFLLSLFDCPTGTVATQNLSWTAVKTLFD